ncbi:methionyl-tRNA formyltransferase [Jatrophihabitans lederbergiae]|uniref:Methionyl-tRNA formyltransferase n=1 Tax=Jatrophihabitans lederbergiae TaxID=3075547 RepID=A0ABU2J4V9_9ACTN|nr:methionyl-tRNA formyltransferase [Jatrophihabitans sp. DSM 44399]MDT0260012.1 methionyl-tRNA formyltransferase [Jatrophihabitans sp. DSM 44399]
MRLLFAGTPAAAVPSLRALLEHPGHEVVAVLTRPDAPSGRGRRLVRSPVAELAQSAGVEVLTPARPSEPEFLDRLRELDVDCAPVVAYGALLREPALSLPRRGWVNLHFSLLPAWRGAAPVQHALLHGDDSTGASTFLIGPGLDDGPVFGVMTELIRPRDTSGDLLERLSQGGAALLAATLDGIADGSLRPQPQSPDGVSLAPKLSTADAEIRFDQPALAIDRRIRAGTPAPGAWTAFGDERLKLGPVTPVDSESALPAGDLRITKRSVLVGTATVPVELGTVQPAGKKPMPAADWARGLRLSSGDILAHGGAHTAVSTEAGNR